MQKHITRSQKKAAYLQQVEQAIPAYFKHKSQLLSLSKMDLRYFDNEIFIDSQKSVELMAIPLPFDYAILQSAWNAALSESDKEFSKIAQKLVLQSEDERTLFLQYNFARKKVAESIQEYKNGSISLASAEQAMQWGSTMRRCRDTLVVANLGLVFSMGRNYGIFANADVSELLPEGFQAVMRAVDGFNIDLGFKFSTYACRSIIQSMNRVKAKIAKRLQREFPSSLDITPESKVDDRDYEHEQDLHELRQVLKSNSANLNDKEMDVVMGRFFDEKKLRDLGNDLDVTKERVRQIQNSAIKKLRQTLSLN